MPRSIRPAPLLLSLALLGACAADPEPAPQVEPTPETGPCFEADLMDGIQDGAEVYTIFECFNEYGAFNELKPLVQWLTASDQAATFVSAANESMGTFDVVGGLEIAARLLSNPDDPASEAAHLYIEAVDADLLRPGVGLLREASAAMVVCEARDDRGSCSVPRLARHLLDTDLPDDLGVVLDAMSSGLTEDEREASVQGIAKLLYATSSLNHDKATSGNDLVHVGRFLLDDTTGDGAPIEQLLPYVQTLVSDDLDGDNGAGDTNPDDDNLLAALARPLAAAWRNGDLQALPDELTYLFTHDTAGDNVGWDGVNLLDELAEVLDKLGGDPTLLESEITLPGASEPTTLVEVALDTLDSLYLNGADVGEIVTQLSDTVELICEGDASNAICDLAGDALPPLTAVAQNSPALARVGLAAIYTIHQTMDVSSLLDLMSVAMKLGIMDETRGLTVASLQNELLPTTLKLVPVFIDTELGRLRPAGRAGQRVLIQLLTPVSFDGGAEVVPATVPLELARQVLHPEYPNADLDFLLGTLGARMQDEDSGLYPETLLALAGTLSDAVGNQNVDLTETLKKALDNEDLWLPAIQLLAEPELADLLTPLAGRDGAAWYLYDLIDGGTLDKILALTADILDLLTENGLIDPGTSTEDDDDAATARRAAPGVSPGAATSLPLLAESAR